MTLAERSLRVALSGVISSDDPTIIADMQAEIDRLRAALTEISKGHWTDSNGRKFATRAAEIAKGALENGHQEGP